MDASATWKANDRETAGPRKRPANCRLQSRARELTLMLVKAIPFASLAGCNQRNAAAQFYQWYEARHEIRMEASVFVSLVLFAGKGENSEWGELELTSKVLPAKTTCRAIANRGASVDSCHPTVFAHFDSSPS